MRSTKGPEGLVSHCPSGHSLNPPLIVTVAVCEISENFYILSRRVWTRPPCGENIMPLLQAMRSVACAA